MRQARPLAYVRRHAIPAGPAFSDVLAGMAVEFRLDVQEFNHVKDREQRRARQEAYRRELNSQVADSSVRRELQAQRIKELEEAHELKSVRILTMYLLYLLIF